MFVLQLFSRRPCPWRPSTAVYSWRAPKVKASLFPVEVKTVHIRALAEDRFQCQCRDDRAASEVPAIFVAIRRAKQRLTDTLRVHYIILGDTHSDTGQIHACFPWKLPSQDYPSQPRQRRKQLGRFLIAYRFCLAESIWIAFAFLFIRVFRYLWGCPWQISSLGFDFCKLALPSYHDDNSNGEKRKEETY